MHIKKHVKCHTYIFADMYMNINLYIYVHMHMCKCIFT